MASQIYNRFDPGQNYQDHRFVPGRPMQSAELNEIQSQSRYSLRQIADTILSDGNVIRDADVIVDPETGATRCNAGAVYLVGQVRGVAPAEFTVPTVGTIAIGLRLVETIITALEDPNLLDPAVGTRAYNMLGAERTQVVAEWGWSGDGLGGQFFPVYTVTDGALNAKEPPPQLDAITQAIARYDRDSTGGSYVVRGLTVQRLADDGDGRQIYSISAGRAYVNGFAVELTASRRLAYDAIPVTRPIVEAKNSATEDAQRINVNFAPIDSIASVSITARKTVTLSRSSVAGTADPLPPEDSVLQILSVKQGATTYAEPADYRLAGNTVDWSPPGAEPATGTTYDVTYTYLAQVLPADVDATGFTVTGAIPGTLVQYAYAYRMPRIDRLCITQDGAFTWLQGASADYKPVRPAVPANMLELAQIQQFWTDQTTVVNDGLRVLSMSTLEAMDERLDWVVQLVAQQKLASDAAQRDAAAKKGMFTDPFLNDSLRDPGREQNGAIVLGALMLPIAATPHAPSGDVGDVQTCAWESSLILSQELRTGSMKINPYMSFGVLPADVKISPAIDRWTETVVDWTSPVTESFYTGGYAGMGFWALSSTTTSEQSVKTSASLEFLRQIDIGFTLCGFGAGEALAAVTFDGLPVEPSLMV